MAPVHQSTTSTDAELYEALELLITTGFFSRRDVLHAFRWTRWFKPEEIHDPNVRRVARLLETLRQTSKEVR